MLRPRRARCFDEVHDIAAFDLVLVMDRYDFTEVRACLRFEGLRSWSFGLWLRFWARHGLRP